MRLRPQLSVAAATAVIVSAMTFGVGFTTPAGALSGPNQALSGTASPMYQTDNSVRALAVSNSVVYAGGLFTTVRPPGSALGSNEVTRTYLAGFSTSTGVPTSFDPTINGPVYSLAVSADGSKLYAAGAFTQVDGQTRNRFAAFDLATGALDPSWAPSASGNGYSVAVSGSTVYLGGTFTKVNAVAHSHLAAVDATTGALMPGFTASASAEVASMALPQDGSRLVIVGNFNTVDGQPLHGSASLDPATGALEPWAASGTLPNTATCTSVGTNVTIVGSTAYIGGEGAQAGCYDGDFAANVSDGTVLWNSPCEGATQALSVVNGVLYKGSHTHDCSYNPGGAFGGFTGALSRTAAVSYKLLAQNPADGSFEHWSPTTNGANGTNVGPQALGTDGTQLFVGGDFTTVNNANQEGLTRFAPGPSAPPARPTTAPVAVPSGSGQLTVTFPAVVDRDNGVLTYTLYRNSTAVATMSAESWPWAQPTLRYTDTGLTPGVSYRYHYTASDGTSTTSSSPTSTATTAVSGVGSYAAAVLALSPELDWPLDDTGTTAADASGNGNSGQFVGGVTTGVAGAVGADAAVSLDGSTGYVAGTTALAPTNTFTESAWFNTSSDTGGSLLGTSANATGDGSATNDVVWMDNDGQVVFAMDTTAPGGHQFFPDTVLRSAHTYNDGRWHQVVTTYDGTTMSLYIDGSLVGSAAVVATTPFQGYLRAGDEDLLGLPQVFGVNSTTVTAPNSYYFAGSVDEVAAYPSALSAAQVATLWSDNATAP